MTSTVVAHLQIRRATTVEWAAPTRGPLLVGEWGMNTDTGEVRIGVGTSWAATPPGVPEVEPEQFAGASDDLQLAAALTALTTLGGGVIKLRPGKSYTWANPVPTLDLMPANHLYVIDITGATITYNGAADTYGWTIKQSTAPGNTRGVKFIGGEYIAPNGNMFLLEDVSNVEWFEPKMNVPNGAFVHLSNKAFWCERNRIVGGEDRGCREVMRFTVDGGSTSFARTLIERLYIKGGVAGVPKINPVDSGVVIGTRPATTGVPHVYDSDVNGVRGNIADGAIVIRLTGNMSGTRLRGLGVECPQRTDTVVVTNASSMVADVSIKATDAGRAINVDAGNGIPAGAFVGTVTAGASFVMVNSVGTPLPATAGGATISLEPLAAYFQLGTVATFPTIEGGDLPECSLASNRMLMFTADPGDPIPFDPAWFPAGLAAEGAITDAKVIKNVGSLTPRTVTDGNLAGQVFISFTAAFTSADLFAAVAGAGIPAGTYIDSIVSATQAHVSQPMTTGNPVSVTITPGAQAIFNASFGNFLVLVLAFNCSSFTVNQGLPVSPFVPFPGASKTVSISQRVTLVVKQDATGGRIYSWPANILWGAQGAPNDHTANSTIVVPLVWDNGVNKWLAGAWTINGGTPGPTAQSIALVQALIFGS